MTAREWMKTIQNKLEMFSAGHPRGNKSAAAWQTMFNHYSDRDVDPDIDKPMTAAEYREWSRRQQ